MLQNPEQALFCISHITSTLTSCFAGTVSVWIAGVVFIVSAIWLVIVKVNGSLCTLLETDRLRQSGMLHLPWLLPASSTRLDSDIPTELLHLEKDAWLVPWTMHPDFVGLAVESSMQEARCRSSSRQSAPPRPFASQVLLSSCFAARMLSTELFSSSEIWWETAFSKIWASLIVTYPAFALPTSFL
jgi:hypothetical protein